MKKFFAISFTILCFASLSFAADFVPTIMTLSVPPQIQYDFDGEDLTIPFTVTGTPAAVWLVINTHGQAEDIVAVQNGFLGWHYVNKIDTTVYVSARYQKDPGETTILWDGNDQDGNAVAAGVYDYYLWAYDNQTPREMACKFVKIAHNWDQTYVSILEVGEDGMPLAQPLLTGSKFFWETAGWDGDEDQWFDHGTHFKWALGGDPYDRSLIQTTVCGNPYIISKDYDEYMSSGHTYGAPVFDPNDYGIFYHCCTSWEAKTETLFKWTFVPEGEAIRDEDWGGWDNIKFEDNPMVTVIGDWGCKAGCFTDRNYIYLPRGPGILATDIEWNNLTCVDFDGEVIFNKNLAEWFMPDDSNPHSYINSGIRYIYSRTPNQWLLIGLVSCMHDMIDTSRIIADPVAGPEDYVIWKNANGDYFLDTAYGPDVEPAWYCLAESATEPETPDIGMRRCSVIIDSNGFNVISLGYAGLASFSVSTQDGTGIGEFHFADDAMPIEIHEKDGTMLVDNGGLYDGLYPSSVITPDTETGRCVNETYFVAFDSAGGMITTEPVAVEEDAQAAFGVAQNSPNPFNPTTSISFTISDNNHVSVDIYNVAGQKVDTLINDFMDAGTHSVVWDASGFSNGVYFYTVKTGDFSKTMKMTLLK